MFRSTGKGPGPVPIGLQVGTNSVTKGGGAGHPESLQEHSREQEPRGEWRPDRPCMAGEILDESKLPKVQAGMATNPNSAGHRTWGFQAHWTPWG